MSEIADLRADLGVPSPPEPVDENSPEFWASDPHLVDRRYDSQHPRNRAGTPEHRQAMKEVQAFETSKLVDFRREREVIVGQDQAGNPVTAEQAEQWAKLNAMHDAFLSAPEPKYASDGVTELIDPDQPEDAAVNDPTTVEYSREIGRRERNRRIAAFEKRPKTHRNLSRLDQPESDYRRQMRENAEALAAQLGYSAQPETTAPVQPSSPVDDVYRASLDRK